MILSTIVLFILKLMGIAPFYIKVAHPNTPMPIKEKLLEFHSSHCAFFYNIFLLLGSIIAFSLVVIYFSTFLVYFESEFDSISEIVMNVLTFLTVCSIWLTVIIKQKVIVDLANDLATVDINLSLLGLDSVSRGNQTNSFILFLLLAIMWSTTFIIQAIHWTWGIMDTVVKVLMVPISFFVMEYAVIVNIMENKFKSLHNRFLFMVDKDFSRESQMMLRLPYDESKCIYFIALRRTYTLLYQCGQKVEKNYSLIILFVIVFLRISFFYVCSVAIEQAFFGQKEWSVLINVGSVIDIIIVFSPMTALSISVAKFQKTMNDTGRMTQELLTYYIDDHELIPELRIFAIELIERKINFMAYGIFDLDCSLILSVLDVTLTDLIVILQLNIKKSQTKEEDYVE